MSRHAVEVALRGLCGRHGAPGSASVWNTGNLLMSVSKLAHQSGVIGFRPELVCSDRAESTAVARASKAGSFWRFIAKAAREGIGIRRLQATRLRSDFRALMDAAPNGRLGIPKTYRLFRKSPPPRPGAIAHPYIVKARPEHADVLEVNALIPKSFTGDRRADICQEILLALLEGRATMEQLRARRDDASFFIKKFWRDNFEMSGHAVSLDAPAGDQTFFEVASSIAAKEWHYGQINDRRSARDALATFHAPTQVEDTFVGQVRRRWISMQEGALASGDMSDMLAFDEVYDLMSMEDRT